MGYINYQSFPKWDYLHYNGIIMGYINTVNNRMIITRFLPSMGYANYQLDYQLLQDFATIHSTTPGQILFLQLRLQLEDLEGLTMPRG